MGNIAIITARGGSKRIPGKNIKSFCGKPIIAYSIEAAAGSGIFDEVMVSTDDRNIADISVEYGAKVPFLRSEKTSDDYATTNDVLMEVLEEYSNRGERFDTACCLYPTAPFVTSDILRNAYNILQGSDSDTLIPVVAFSYPVQRAFVIRDGYLSYEYPEYMKARSQDLVPRYHDAGQFYMFRTGPYISNGTFISDNIIPYVMPQTHVQDIDNEEDWIIAEMKYNIIQSGKTY
ncbi:MAG: pseudaminic acid cytidylyltransferase [Lachnospiraceae bacterium]|nr:pseudaminic acid cytidylyltransferase [Lachnospiraceae bacterium]